MQKNILKSHKNHKHSLSFDFKSIDQPLRLYFIKTFMSLGVLFLAILAMSIITRNLSLLLIGLTAIIILCGNNLFRIMKCLEGSIARLDGICVETSFSTKKLRIKHGSGHMPKRSYLLLRTTDSKYIKIYNVQKLRPSVGNKIVIYFPINSLYNQNEDTYFINYYYHATITKSHTDDSGHPMP